MTTTKDGNHRITVDLDEQLYIDACALAEVFPSREVAFGSFVQLVRWLLKREVDANRELIE